MKQVSQALSGPRSRFPTSRAPQNLFYFDIQRFAGWGKNNIKSVNNFFMSIRRGTLQKDAVQKDTMQKEQCTKGTLYRGYTAQKWHCTERALYRKETACIAVL